MPEQRRFRLLVTGPARADIAAIVRWSYTKFGEAAAVRYEGLILQALRDIEADPERPGAKPRPELKGEGLRTYHLSFSRSRVPKPGVKTPRHFLIYRAAGPGVLEVLRVLHETRDLILYLPET